MVKQPMECHVFVERLDVLQRQDFTARSPPALVEVATLAQLLMGLSATLLIAFAEQHRAIPSLGSTATLL
jgi:hypothetical protein